MFEVSLPIHLLLVAAWLPQCAVQASLQLLEREKTSHFYTQKYFANLDPDHHVEMSLRVLLYSITHIIRLLGLKDKLESHLALVNALADYLLELSTSNKIFDFSDSSDGIFVGIGQA